MRPSSPSGNPSSLWKLEKSRKPEGKGPCHHLDFSPVWFGQNNKKMNRCYLKPLCLWQFVTAATGIRVDTNIRLEATHGGVVIRSGSGRKEQSVVCGAEARRLHLPGGSAPGEMARPRGERLWGGIWVGGTPGYLGSQVRDLRPQGCLSHVLDLQSPALDPGLSSATPVGAIPSILWPKTECRHHSHCGSPSPSPSLIHPVY